MKQLVDQALRNRLRPLAYSIDRSLTGLRGRLAPSARRPDFLILGAQKAGTTTLYDLLIQHPNIASARTKEIAFFDRYYDLGFTWYSANFPRSTKRLTGEATPDYLFLDEARQRIVWDLPYAKFIVVLRNPVDRAVSHYFHARRLGYETLEIEAAFASERERITKQAKKIAGARLEHRRYVSAYSYRTRGLYAQQLSKWFDVVPRERFYIETSDRLFARSGEVMQEVFAFLGIDTDVPITHLVKNIGTYGSVPDRLRDELTVYFQSENEALRQLTGLPLPW